MSENLPDDVSPEQIDRAYGFNLRAWLEEQELYVTCPHCGKKTEWYDFLDYKENELAIVNCDWCTPWFIARWWTHKGSLNTETFSKSYILEVMQDVES